MTSDAQVRAENRVVIAHVYTATAAIALGAVLGLLQALSRADAIELNAPLDYYKILTLHGVLMAIVFTTFFICGFSLFSTYRLIPRERKLTLGWLGYGMMLVGTVMAAIEIFLGNATVLYTFYAPLKADPLFYLGATILILGTWVVVYEILENVAYFRRTHPGERIPLAVYAAAATFMMWWIATLGVVAELGLLLPWSLGWTSGINVMLSRMFFWYFGHPLVYFWIMGAYAVWYTVVPTRFGGTVFSDALTRLTFLFLVLLSTPVGIHHEFMEPGISTTWKLLHTVLTYGVAIPSFLTAFAMFATFEIAARKKGLRGFVATIKDLPWNDPVFTGPAYGMLLFIMGGFGGLINASYEMDAVVHNTIWIVGHFHVTVGGPVALTLLGAAYWMIPKLTGRKLWAPKLALLQTQTWFVGMFVMSIAMHYAGLLGAPRRTAHVLYAGSSVAETWHPYMVMAAVGGTILALSILTFAVVAVGTLLVNDKTEDMKVEYASAEPGGEPSPMVFELLPRWGAFALALAAVAYSGPLGELIRHPGFLAPGMRTW